MTAAQKRGKAPREFRPTRIDYDARIFALREWDETVALTVLGGRIHLPRVLGDYPRQALKGKRPTAATGVRRKGGFDIHLVVEEADAEPCGGPAMGVDLGIRNTAATRFNTLHRGAERQHFKADRARIRASLQSKNTRGARRVLRRLSGYEGRRIQHENHVLAKRIVSEAQRHECGTLRMEQLSGIRERTKIRNKHLNRLVAGGSFGPRQGFVGYKAQRAGMAVELVDPAYSSKTCSRCGQRGVRRQDVFLVYSLRGGARGP
jgi:IS605 OrfB family transposase